MFIDIHKNTIVVDKTKNQSSIFNINVSLGWIQLFFRQPIFRT